MWTLDDLRLLDAVIAEGNFAAASRRLGTTRSAVSKSVRRLEGLLEAQLFARTTHEVRPTEVAKL
ncbi:MAG: LysR family transcriptional regulator, partial [Myxococcota bacterium]